MAAQVWFRAVLNVRPDVLSDVAWGFSVNSSCYIGSVLPYVSIEQDFVLRMSGNFPHRVEGCIIQECSRHGLHG